MVELASRSAAIAGAAKAVTSTRLVVARQFAIKRMYPSCRVLADQRKRLHPRWRGQPAEVTPPLVVLSLAEGSGFDCGLRVAGRRRKQGGMRHAVAPRAKVACRQRAGDAVVRPRERNAGSGPPRA